MKSCGTERLRAVAGEDRQPELGVVAEEGEVCDTHQAKGVIVDTESRVLVEVDSVDVLGDQLG
jgi:hypothetical protein